MMKNTYLNEVEDAINDLSPEALAALKEVSADEAFHKVLDKVWNILQFNVWHTVVVEAAEDAIVMWTCKR